MTLQVMGRTQVIDAGGNGQEITGQLQRSLLALLVIAKASWTPPLTLTDGLWPSGPDDTRAEGRLHVLVHRLRARIGESTIEHSEHGYRVTPAVKVDIWMFEEAMDRWLRERGSLARTGLTLPRLEEVLGLWGGAPYAGLDHPHLVAEADRLLGLYVSGQETRFQHLLDLGEHATVLREVVPLAHDHPLRERLLVVWMTALMRTGGRTEAMELYQRFEHRLSRELGVAPGRELDELRRMAEVADWSESHQALLPDVQADVDEDGQNATEQRATAERWATRGRLGDALRLLGQVEVHCRVNRLDEEHALVLRSMSVVSCQIGDLNRGLRLATEARAIATSPEVTAHLVTSEALILTYLHRDDDAHGVLQSLDPAGLPAPAATLWWRARAGVLRHRGDRAESVLAARKAHALVGALGGASAPSVLRGLVDVDLGTALRDAEDRSCFKAYESAIELVHAQGARTLAALAHASVAKAWLQWDEPARSNVHSREALQLAQSCGAWGIAGRAALRLADSLDLLGEPVRAAWYRTEGLSHLRRVDYPIPLREREHIEALVAAAEAANPAESESTA